MGGGTGANRQTERNYRVVAAARYVAQIEREYSAERTAGGTALRSAHAAIEESRDKRIEARDAKIQLRFVNSKLTTVGILRQKTFSRAVERWLADHPERFNACERATLRDVAK